MGRPPTPPSLQRHPSSRPLEPIHHPSGSLSPFSARRYSRSGDIDGSEAIWQEMQSALAEVELSALTSEQIFGEKHSEALEELRSKQLKLAQAWARSGADDEVVDSKSATDQHQRPASARKSPQGGTAAAGGAGSQRGPVDDVSRRTLDEDTEKDIQLARERRDANDRYFNRVNQGVLEVVAKLEEVAQAMRAVERESKDIWSDAASIDTTAPSTSNAG